MHTGPRCRGGAHGIQMQGDGEGLRGEGGEGCCATRKLMWRGLPQFADYLLTSRRIAAAP